MTMARVRTFYILIIVVSTINHHPSHFFFSLSVSLCLFFSDFLPSDDKEEKWHCACCIVEFRGNRLPRDEDHHVAQQIEQKKEAASSKNQQQRTFLVGSKKMGDPTFSEETAEDEASEEETSYDDEISHSEYETSDDEEASDVDLDHTLFETDHVATNSDDGVVDVAINEVFDEQQAASWRMPKGLGGLCHDTITWMMPTWLQELLCDVGGHAIAMWIGRQVTNGHCIGCLISFLYLNRAFCLIFLVNSELLYKRPPLYQMEPVYVLLSFLHFLLAYACHYSWDKYAVCHPVIKVTAAQFVLYSLLVVWLESPDGHTWSSTGIKLWRRASEAVSVTALVLILSMTPLGIDLSANKELRIAVTFGIAAVASYFL